MIRAVCFVTILYVPPTPYAQVRHTPGYVLLASGWRQFAFRKLFTQLLQRCQIAELLSWERMIIHVSHSLPNTHRRTTISTQATSADLRKKAKILSVATKSNTKREPPSHDKFQRRCGALTNTCNENNDEDKDDHGDDTKTSKLRILHVDAFIKMLKCRRHSLCLSFIRKIL